MKLLCFDPGETTGWALFAGGEIVGGTFPMWGVVPKLIQEHDPDVILYEAFHLRQNAAHRLVGSSFPTVEVIGVIKFCASRVGILVVAQPPAARVGIRLVRIPGLTVHGRDAAKHGLRYLIKQGLADDYKHYRRRRRPSAR